MNRRSFLTGLLAAPLVVKAEVLMPVQSVIMPARTTSFPQTTRIYYWRDIAEGNVLFGKPMNMSVSEIDVQHWWDGRNGVERV